VSGYLRVGVVGHRNDRLRPEDVPQLSATVGGILGYLQTALDALGDSAPAGVSVTSALAEGADRIGALAAVASGYPLHCPLPFARAEYEKDFPSPESRWEFGLLVRSAERVWELEGSREDAPAAYADVGDAVLAHSDVLVAIWDGQDARGRGGTAEVVRAAASRMPVLWILPDEAAEVRVGELEEDGGLRWRVAKDLAADMRRLVAASVKRGRGDRAPGQHG